MALSSLFITLPIPKFPSSNSRRLLTARASSAAAAASASFDLRRYWTSLIADVESELDAAMPMQPLESIHSAMRYAVLPGAGKEGAAKRAPPVLCVAACELLGGPRAAALPAAAALEMLHAASLVHDDLPCFDAAPTRRGRPSTHAANDTDMAVLAGDALFPLAYTHVISHTPSPDPAPHAVLLRVLAELACAVGSTGMAAGQFLDLVGATALGEAEVMQVLTKKFGEMAECSAACGAMLGGAEPDEEAALRRYGRTIGVLYELVDDVRSASGNGKMRRNASVLRSLGMERALGVEWREDWGSRGRAWALGPCEAAGPRGRKRSRRWKANLKGGPTWQGERSCGTQPSEREEQGKGSKDISHALADCAPACSPDLPAT